MKICFVGLHNKPGKQALDSSTKSGQIIDRIIKESPKGIQFTKVNLFDTDYLPKGKEKERLANKFICTVVQFDTLYIGLGAVVSDCLAVDLQHRFYSIYHPGYILRQGKVEWFVKSVVNLIDRLYSA